MARRGLLITIEGPDGSGKTTLAKKLCQRLKKNKIPFIFTLEPGGTKLTKIIRQILLHSKHQDLSSLTELFLFEADRAEHVSKVVRPALEKGKIVICARFFDSTTAYQGYGRGLDIEMVKKLNLLATQGIKPDLTLLIDIDAEVGLRRAKRFTGSLDRLEKEKITFHRRLRRGYLELAKKEPRRFRLISGLQPIKKVEDQAWQSLEKILRFLK